VCVCLSKNIEDRLGRTAEAYCSGAVWALLDAQTLKKKDVKSKSSAPLSTTSTNSKQFFKN